VISAGYCRLLFENTSMFSEACGRRPTEEMALKESALFDTSQIYNKRFSKLAFRAPWKREFRKEL